MIPYAAAVDSPAGPMRSAILQRWWPAIQAMELALAPPKSVVAAVVDELTRTLPGERIERTEHLFGDLNAAFAAVPGLSVVPTWFLVLATRSPWTVVWSNGASCSGYDALASNLTRRHGLTTLHFLAHDEVTTTEPGALFHHRRRVEDAMRERSVYVGREAGRWRFHTRGEPLPEEDPSGYEVRRVRDRLDEARLMALLARCGAEPWQERFYALEAPSFVVHRPDAPATVAPLRTDLGAWRDRTD